MHGDVSNEKCGGKGALAGHKAAAVLKHIWYSIERFVYDRTLESGRGLGLTESLRDYCRASLMLVMEHRIYDNVENMIGPLSLAKYSRKKPLRTSECVDGACN